MIVKLVLFIFQILSSKGMQQKASASRPVTHKKNRLHGGLTCAKSSTFVTYKKRGRELNEEIMADSLLFYELLRLDNIRFPHVL